MSSAKLCYSVMTNYPNIQRLDSTTKSVMHTHNLTQSCANIRDLLSRIGLTFENMQSIGVMKMFVLIESKHRSGISLKL